eukprot:2663780-Rhodomonas_salina.2
MPRKRSSRIVGKEEKEKVRACYAMSSTQISVAFTTGCVVLRPRLCVAACAPATRRAEEAERRRIQREEEERVRAENERKRKEREREDRMREREQQLVRQQREAEREKQQLEAER